MRPPKESRHSFFWYQLQVANRSYFVASWTDGAYQCNRLPWRACFIVVLSPFVSCEQHLVSPATLHKKQYDKKSRPANHGLGDWAMVKFPKEESSKQRKLSWPRHGPYSVTHRNDLDIIVVKVYFPEEGAIQVHQSRVCSCPPRLLAGFYWYGGNKKSPGCLSTWLAKMLSEHRSNVTDHAQTCEESDAEHELPENPDMESGTQWRWSWDVSWTVSPCEQSLPA